jgi:hypothetical protein
MRESGGTYYTGRYDRVRLYAAKVKNIDDDETRH